MEESPQTASHQLMLVRRELSEIRDLLSEAA
jgi:hypothetical protein